jgi:flagellar M-ring protein FliF
MGFIQVLRERIARINSQFTAGQKTMVVLAVVALGAGGFLFAQWAGKPSYAPLYSNLDAADAAAITEKLTADGVPYELADGGRTVMVPSESVYQTRLDASAEGLPAGGGDGYALLDKQGVTTSEFRQRVDYQRAMEGELARTIEAMDGIETASVKLVIPPEDVFSDSEQKPSASVLLKTKLGVTLSDDQVRAVDHLIASSISGLDPAAITIADSKGTVLLAPGADGAASSGGDIRTRQTQAYEAARAAELQAMLDKVVGPGKSVVKVNADLDFDKRTTTSETYDKTQAPVLAEQSTSESYANGQPGTTGVLGQTDTSNTQAGTTGNGAYGKNESRKDYGVGKTTEEVQAVPGKINRLNVSVLIDGTATANPADLQKAIAAASGIDTRRGDVIEVTRVPFDNSASATAEADLKAEQAQAQRAQLIGYARTGGLVLLVLIILFLAWRNMRKAAKASKTPIDLAELERQRATLTRTDEPAPAAELPEPEPVEARPLELTSEDRKRMAVQEEVGELIQRQPEEVARLLRGWLADRRT